MPSSAAGQIQLSIDSCIDNISLLSGALRGVGRAMQVPDASMQQIELILVEWVNNVIEHAYLNHCGHPVIVSIGWHPEDVVRLTVSDEGRCLPLDVSSRLCERRIDFPVPSDLPEGGWGLGLVCCLADGLEYTSDATGNHFTVLKQVS